MCQSTEEIKANDIVIKDLMGYESDYEVEKSSGGNGDNEYRLAITRAMIQSRVDSIQIKQDLQPLVKTMRESPSLATQFKNRMLVTAGKVVFIGFLMFMGFYTFVEVCGYAEALMVFK